MPENLSDSVTGAVELIFPDDATDEPYSLRELAVYDAEEVRDEMGTDIPQYGSWLPIEMDDGDEAWLTAPSQLRQKLVNQDAKPGERFIIDRMVKDGRDPSTPYQVELTFPERATSDDRQTGLSQA
jgi:hypothetical protein